MSNWKSTLKGDPIPWLLEPDNPSVRYWTLRDLLDRRSLPYLNSIGPKRGLWSALSLKS